MCIIKWFSFGRCDQTKHSESNSPPFYILALNNQTKFTMGVALIALKEYLHSKTTREDRRKEQANCAYTIEAAIMVSLSLSTKSKSALQPQLPTRICHNPNNPNNPNITTAQAKISQPEFQSVAITTPIYRSAIIVPTTTKKEEKERKRRKRKKKKKKKEEKKKEEKKKKKKDEKE